LVRYLQISSDPQLNTLTFVTTYTPLDIKGLMELTYTEQQIKNYIIQILQLMKFLCNKGISNINLKPGNILALVDGTIIIRDFLAVSYLQGLGNETQASFQSVTENDISSFARIIKDFHSIQQTLHREILISKSFAGFLQALNRMALVPLSPKHFDELLCHEYLTENVTRT
jgi:serine/threonine protein kinase